MAAPPPRGGPGDRDAELADEVIEERNRRNQQAQEDLHRHANGLPVTVDGSRHPSHARGVSVRTPEIITVFDYLPLYNNSNPPVTSKGGQLFDIQVNARRIRIQQLYSLLEELSKDPESATAKIVEQLKAEMIEEMKGVQSDFNLYRAIHDVFYGYLGSFDLLANQDELLKKTQIIRDQRFEQLNPSLREFLPEEISNFTNILKSNHGFKPDLIEASSNTKLLLYIMYDLSRYLLEAGPGFASRLRSIRPSATRQKYQFTLSPERLRQNLGYTTVLRPRRDLDADPFGDRESLYHTGRLGLSLWMLGTVDDAHIKGDSLSYYPTDNQLGTIIDTEPQAISMLLSTISRDMAVSSGILTEEVQPIINGTDATAVSRLFSFPLSNSPTGILETPRNLEFGSLTDNALKAERANPTPDRRPTPLFDPQLDESPPQFKIDNLKTLVIDNILNTAEEDQFSFEGVDAVLGKVGNLSTLSQAFESLAALNVPELQPQQIFKRLLTIMSDCLGRLNPSQTADGYRDDDFLDLCLIAECTKNIETEGKFPETTDGSQTIIPMMDLVNMLLYKMGRGDGFYSHATLRPGQPIFRRGFGDRRTDDPNLLLLDNIETAIKDYLTTRHNHWINYFQPRRLYINPDSELNPNNYSGVYYDRFHNDDNNRKRSASVPDDFQRVDSSVANDGYFNVMDRDELFPLINATGAAKLKKSDLILTSISRASESRRPSIFKDIVTLLNDLDSAALQRSEYYVFDEEKQRNQMRYSGVDNSVIGSFVLNALSIMVRSLTKITFNEASSGGHNGRFVWLRAPDHDLIENLRDDLFSFRNDGMAGLDQLQPENQAFISEVMEAFQTDNNMINDAVDLMTGITKLIADNSSDLVSALRSDTPTGRLIQQQKGKLISIVDPSQQALAQNKYAEFTSRLQNNQYFDNFLEGRDTESAILSFCKTDQMFREGFGDNLKILAVGIPDGFSRNVLDYRLLSNNPSHRRTKVRIKVHRHDILLNNTLLNFGESPPGREPDEQFKITFKPKEFDFDLRLFYKGLSPIIGAEQDIRVSQLDNDNNATRRPRVIDDRRFIDFNSLVQGNFIFRKFDDKLKQFNDVTFPFTGPDTQRAIFANHAVDFIAKSYIRSMTGAKLTEETFLIDRAREGQSLTPGEIIRFIDLINQYIGSIAPGGNVNDYLSGSRATRELLRRLEGNGPTSPIVESVLITDNNLSEDINVKLTEDMIRFTKMITPDSLLFGPSSTRQSVIEPKLFERVFCLFVDPDSFEIDDIDPAFKNKLVEVGLIQPDTDPPVLSQITNLMSVPQFNQFYVEVI